MLISTILLKRIRQGRHDRDVVGFGEFDQFLRRARRDDAAAGVDAGAFRRGDHRLDFADRSRVERRVGVIVFQFGSLIEIDLALLLLHVLRDVDHHRAGAAGLRDVESLAHDAGNVVRVKHQKTVLHDRAGHADDVGFLKHVLADHRAGHLPGDEHCRDRIHIGVGDAGNEVGSAGAAGGHADADPAAGACIAARCESAALLVARQHHAHSGAAQCLMQLDGLSARIREYDINSEKLQTFDRDFAALQKSGRLCFHDCCSCTYE